METRIKVSHGALDSRQLYEPEYRLGSRWYHFWHSLWCETRMGCDYYYTDSLNHAKYVIDRFLQGSPIRPENTKYIKYPEEK